MKKDIKIKQKHSCEIHTEKRQYEIYIEANLKSIRDNFFSRGYLNKHLLPLF